MADASKESHKKVKEKERLARASLSHSVLKGERHDYFNFKTSKRMFGFNYEKCSGAESNNI